VLNLSGKDRGEFGKGVQNGGNRHEVVKRGNRGGLETAAHLADNGILGDLESFDETFVVRGGGVEGEAICEDWEDQGMEEFSPVGIVKTMD